MSPRGAKYIYAGIRVKDLDRSLAFYRILGFHVRNRGTMKHGGIWVHLVQPNSARRIELNYYPPGTRFYTPPADGPEFDHFGFWVDDVDKWYRTLKRAGGRTVYAPFDDGGSTLAYLEDPDGFPIEIFGARRKRRHP